MKIKELIDKETKEKYTHIVFDGNEQIFVGNERGNMAEIRPKYIEIYPNVFDEKWKPDFNTWANHSQPKKLKGG